tara:strand:- start:17791 stop:18534 length:744 start_codon:yes stop_codon:yes gene_type:complete
MTQLDKPKIFGVGFSKTGTTSLEAAFENLGRNVCKGDWRLKHNDYNLALYVDRNFEELRRMTHYWDAFADGPWGGGGLYKQLYDWYPDAFFVQTVRDPEMWYNSFERMITSFAEDEDLATALESYHQRGAYGSALFFRNVFQIKKLEGARDKIIDYYISANAEVEAFFESKAARFIRMDITNGEGWHELCSFLGVEKPNIPFPVKNVAPNSNASLLGVLAYAIQGGNFQRICRGKLKKVLNSCAAKL